MCVLFFCEINDHVIAALIISEFGEINVSRENFF